MTRVAELIEKQEVVSVSPTESVRDVAIRMSERNVGAVPVIDASRIVGMFTERDLMTRVVARSLDPGSTTVADVMTREVSTVQPDEDSAQCIERMRSLNCRHLPVTQEGKVVGIVSFRDILQLDQRAARAKAELLTDLMTNKPEYES